MVRTAWLLALSLIAQPTLSAEIIEKDQNPQRVTADWKTLFNELFAWNIEKNNDPAKSGFETSVLKKQSLYYSPDSFNKTYKEITSHVEVKEKDGSTKLVSKTADQVFNSREEVLSNPANHEKLQSQNLSDISGMSNLSNDAKDLLGALQSQKGQPIQKNYFTTELGQRVMKALKDTVLIVIPGFGSHTIADYTYPELVEAANIYYGRPAVRRINPQTKKYDGDSAPEKFYEPKKEIMFDVLHPLGLEELGYSTGRDVYSANHLAKWIANLPAAYQNKKLILVGYSKGAGIAHNCVANHPEIRKRTRMIVTIAGVVQGAVPAESAIRTILDETKSTNIDQATNWIKGQPEFVSALLNPVLAPLVTVALNAQALPLVKTAMQAFLHTSIGAKVNENLQVYFGDDLRTLTTADQVDETIKGIYDMSNYARIKWNLENMNEKVFNSPIAIFNLSDITNIKDFFLPAPPVNNQKTISPLTIPQVLSEGTIDHRWFSIDNLFLHLTSLMGFQQSKGGLFDTQVAWVDTKSMYLDERPLSENLTPDELKKMRSEILDVYQKNTGKTLPENFGSLPRNSLLPEAKSIDYVDLGEMRATHWSLAFQQVYKPANVEKGKYYEHTFPRQAFLTALVETLSVYALANPTGGK